MNILDVSRTNIVIWNTIQNNNIGIKNDGISDGNLFHHNNLVDNSINAYDSSVDRWDNENHGNYWSDYTGNDVDEDGIGDIPYNIPGGENIDRYPLMTPWEPPNTPQKPSGPTSVKPGKTQIFSTLAIDPNGNRIKYGWDWGDGSQIEWTNYANSGELITKSHSWLQEGDYQIMVIAKDENNQKSFEWSDPLPISVPKSKQSMQQAPATP